MSFVIVAGERYALDAGETLLGGDGPTALPAPELAHLPAVAAIDVPLDGPSSVRSLVSAPVTLNGAPLGGEGKKLRHGDRLEVAGIAIAFGDIRRAGRTAHVSSVKAPTESGMPAMQQSPPTATTGGRLTRLADRAVFVVGERGLTLGRDPDSGVVLTSPGVSRTHAVIAPSLLGYTLKDQSTNGVWINGERVDGLQVLGQGDVLTFGQEQFRFDADEANFEPTVSAPAEQPTAAPEAHAVPVPAPRPVERLLATLEVTSEGPLKGKRFRIERTTAQLGRGNQNDVQLLDDSVSSTHASLVLQGNTWLLLDLGSRNGTRVEGELVRTQRELPSVCELKLGALTLLFRVINAGEPRKSSTVQIIGMK